ncbi:hydroxyisourate hydrolase [Ralstonia sp. R-29]|uniref:hydroxyisourate hydrolase n=1 Tax=Ralstonia sp. R-29 TaxID=3404059 RepID=UPI003CF1772D
MQFRRWISAAALAAASSLAGAAEADLSVHVLDQQTGKPATAVRVTLDARANGVWRTIAQGTTDDDGRIKALLPRGQALATGDYRVTFDTGAYFSKHNTPTFFPEVPVVFHVQDAAQHYHIPLLLSPFGFSTYRGS